MAVSSSNAEGVADSGDTRSRIIDVARSLFAQYGYEATSNRMIVETLGITTAAIYYHFDSKLTLYQEVDASTRKYVYSLFEEALAVTPPRLDEQVRAIFEVAHQLNNTDRSLSRFLMVARVDRRRVAGLADVTDSTREGLFGRLVDDAVRSGQVAPENRHRVVACLHTFTVGLSFDASDDPVEHRAAFEGLLAMLQTFIMPEAAN